VADESFDERSFDEVYSLIETGPNRGPTPVTPADHALFAELMTLLRATQSAAERLEERAASVLGVHRTAARCVEILLRESSLSAGELAESVGVSRSGTTPLLDRLEDAGIIHRRRPPDEDRRRVTIDLTAVGRTVAQQFWDELYERVARLAQGYSREELQVVRDFLVRANVILSGGEPPVRITADSVTPPPDDLGAPSQAGVRPSTLGTVPRTTLGSPRRPR
jgi:DNA-binding MarR family transcriptional regulator